MSAWRDPFTLAVLAAFAVVSVLGGAPELIEYDSAQFALAAFEHDVRLHQPHPPGFVFFIWALQVLVAVTGDAYVALRALAVLQLVLAMVVLHGLAREAYDVVTARIAVVVFATSPVVLHHAFSTMIYPAEALASAAVAWACVRARRGNRRAFLLAALLLGLLGGLRQTALVLLFPLVLVTAMRARLRPVDLAVGGLAGTAGIIAWLVPQLYYAGGLESYLEANRMLQTHVSAGSAMRAGLRRIEGNLHRGLTVVLLGVGAFRFMTLAVRRLRAGPDRDQAPPRGLDWPFALAWVLPTAVFLLLYHFPKPGYALTIWPPLCLGLARVVVRVATGPRAHRALALATALDLLVYFALPTAAVCCRRPWEVNETTHPGPNTLPERAYVPAAWNQPMTWSPFQEALVRGVLGKADFFFDRTWSFYYDGHLRAMRELGYPRADTLLIGGLFSRIASYSMPDQPILHVDPNRPIRTVYYRDRRPTRLEDTVRLPAGIRQILIEGWNHELIWLAPDPEPLPQGMPPPLRRRLSAYEVGDGPVDVWYFLRVMNAPDRAVRLLREPAR